MAKETKQDRIVRGMLDQVTEHLHELKVLDANSNTKESDTERWAQGFLKNCMGYMASSGYSIRAQQTKGKHRPDLTVYKDEKPVVIVEVKRPGFNLSKSDFRSGKVQIGEYLQALGNVKYGMLTNGTEWRLFDFSVAGSGGVQIANFDLKDDEHGIDTSKRAVEEICYEIYDFHETAFNSGDWVTLAKEATVFSPDSLARAILTTDVVKYISKVIRNEHEYKANFEVLVDRVHYLLEEGLNDSAVWNEAKSIELQKFVKSQKRSARKSRKASVTSISENIAAVEVLTPVDVVKTDVA